MPINNLSSPLKRWSLLFFLFIFLGVFATASSSFAACEYLSSGDFSSGSGWTVNDTTYWSLVNGMLDADGMVDGTSVYAKTAFYPDGFFSADVDVSILRSSKQYDRVGIRFRTSGDVLFGVNGDSGQITTNGVLCYYYPTAGLLRFMVYDIAGEWVVPIAARSVSGPVDSIGLSMVADGIIFRINRQDTGYKLSGDFSFGPLVVDELYLYAGSGADEGGTLHARFDNVCASPYEVTDFQPGNAMPLPNGQEAAILTAPAASPVVSIDPATANPLGFGPAAGGGNILSLTAGISGLLYSADLYVGIGIGADIYLFDANNNLHRLSTDGLVKWRANTTGGLNNVPLLPPGIDMSGIPGTYNFYFLMTPAGRLDSFRLWVTPLVIGGGGGSSTVTDTAMRDEIKQNIDLIFGITSGFSGGLTEVMSIFNEKSVVTMTPVNSAGDLDLMAVLGGSPLTINANFGSGYTMQSGKIMGGSARIVANPSFSDTSLGASFSGTFNNVTKDGAPFANGQLSGNVSLTEGAGEKTNVSGQININNLSISGQQLSGTIDISGTLEDFDLGALLGLSELDLSTLLQMKGTIRLTFTNFISGDYTINGGYVDIVSTGSGSANVITNLQTATGPVTLNMSLTTSATGAVINTTAPGAAGPYTLSMNNVTLDQNACANYPTAGTMSFTSGSTGKTGVVTFTGACNGTYGYSER